MQKRVHCGVNSVPPQKMPVMPVSLNVLPCFSSAVAERFEQLRRGEHALDVVPGREDRQRLVDAVLLVRLQVLHPALLDELDDPPRIEIDAEADAAAVLARCSTASRSRRGPLGPEHQPVGPLGKILVGQRVAEKFS